ncbi:TPA: hypothetical protein QDB28_004189 [Burkholderia vietnamiensis]|nr:hypothetical protein [Burkholderia vietnamiensis]
MSDSTLPESLSFFDGPLEYLSDKYSLEEFSKKIESTIPPESGFKGLSSWEEFESIRGMLRFLAVYNERAASEYFISPQTELIYNLVKLQGEAQQKALGITVALYKSNAKAKTWWRKLSSVIHPDRCKHRDATQAAGELNRLYEEMMKNGR